MKLLLAISCSMDKMASLKPFKSQLILDTKIIDEKKLYVLLNKNQEGARLAKIFNRGLKKLMP